jgi:hypothetical protein
VEFRTKPGIGWALRGALCDRFAARRVWTVYEGAADPGMGGDASGAEREIYLCAEQCAQRDAAHAVGLVEVPKVCGRTEAIRMPSPSWAGRG